LAICNQKLDLLTDYTKVTGDFAKLCGLLLRATSSGDLDSGKFMEVFQEAAVARIKAQDAKMALALHREQHGC
jgi:hypothetical protein